MSNVAVRRQESERSLAEAAPSWDPWRMMRALFSWDPFRELTAFPSALEEEGKLLVTAAFDVKETKDAYEFRADLPGVDQKDLEVTVTANRLTVSGKREADKEDKSERYYAFERRYGSFTRSFTLPDDADSDKLRASLDKGVLAITVPKKPEMQPKKVAVKSQEP